MIQENYVRESGPSRRNERLTKLVTVAVATVATSD